MKIKSAVVLAVSIAALLFAGCGGGSSASPGDKQACALVDGMVGKNYADASAVKTLNQIADTASNLQVIKKANAMAILLEGTGTQTQIKVAFGELDAACSVAIE
jgi:hypothetical protein